MTLSGELNYRIRYDVEHDLFHAQNIFNDEYITPTFIEYAQKLEKENAELTQKITGLNETFNRLINDIKDCAKPNVRYDIDDLIDDWDIELED